MGAEKEFGEFLTSFFKRAVERGLRLELEFDSQSFEVDGNQLTLNGRTVLSSSGDLDKD